jgi:hypothetical protein
VVVRTWGEGWDDVVVGIWGEGWDPIHQFNTTTFLWLSPPPQSEHRFLTSYDVMVFFYVQEVEMRGYWLFCWYWWNCWS